MKTITVGVNAAQPAVLIWEFIREFFAEANLPLEFALYSSQDRMVEALVKGEVDIDWHGPMGYVATHRATDGHCQGLGMRDGDVDYKSLLVVPPGSAIRNAPDLVGKRLAIGYEDSLDNTIMPLYYMRQAEIPVDSINKVRPIGARMKGRDYQGEAQAVAAVREGRADATFVGYKFWDTVLSKNEDGGSSLEAVWETPPRGHCVFTAMDDLDPELVQTFKHRLFQMDYDDPAQRQVMELEWVKQWVEPKMDYEDLMEATRA